MKPFVEPERDIMKMKCAVYYRQGRLKIWLVRCDNAKEAVEWCKENCEIRKPFEYYYNGNQIFFELY